MQGLGKILRHWGGVDSRVWRVYAVNMSEGLRLWLGAGLVFLDDWTGWRVRIAVGGSHVEMRDHVSGGQLEVKYGGSVRNLVPGESQFWPPRAVCEDFGVAGNVEGGMYVTVKEYYEKVQRGEFGGGEGRVCQKLVLDYIQGDKARAEI